MGRVEHFQDGSQQLDLFHDGFYAAGKDVRKKILDESLGPEEKTSERVPHPKTGYRIEVGKIRQVKSPESQPFTEEKPLGTEGPPLWSVRNKKMEDMGFGTPGPDEPITHVYRGMSEEEWQHAQHTGVISSDARRAILPAEGTNAAVDRDTALSYAHDNKEGPSRVVKMAVHPDDGWFTIAPDDYIRTRTPVPLSRVQGVTPPLQVRDLAWDKRMAAQEAEREARYAAKSGN